MPEGEWIYYYTGEKLVGGKWIVKGEGLNRVPFFVKKGSQLIFTLGKADNVEGYLRLPTTVRNF
jgi:alpha-glucosidase (family GH31 glycosyl hydrolase)